MTKKPRILMAGAETESGMWSRAARLNRAGARVEVIAFPWRRFSSATSSQQVLERVESGSSFGKEFFQRVWAFKPDDIHTFGIGDVHRHLLERDRRKLSQGHNWIVSPSEDDILFDRSGRERSIRSILAKCHGFFGETKTDGELAALFGFRGRTLVPWLDIPKSKKPKPKKKLIRVFTDQSAPDRAWVAWYSLTECASLVKKLGYRVTTPLPEAFEARMFSARTGIEVLSTGSDRECISIDLSIRHGIGPVYFESIQRGVFPIVSAHESHAELARTGLQGSWVHPEEPGQVISAIVRSLSDVKWRDAQIESNLSVAERIAARQNKFDVMAELE